MTIIFPTYLNSPAFQFRHLVIRVMQNNDKMATGAEAAETALAKSVSLGKVVGNSAKNALDGALSGTGSAKDSIAGLQKMSQEMDRIFKNNISALHTLVLPLPNSMQDSASHEWSVEKGVAGEIVGAVKATGVGSLGSKALAIAADMSNMRKPLEDPGYFQSYGGTQPRDFSFSFDLVPNNPEEASNIWQLINVLKQYSSPSTVVTHAIMLSPHYFQIEFPNVYLNTMVNAKDVVLKSINVDYGADGNMQFTPDGVPKHIKLDLTFSERKMMTQEMYGG